MSGKISFGFSKVKTKTTLQSKQQTVREKVEYITSFDKSEKKREDAPLPELIIPCRTSAGLEGRSSIKRKHENESTNKNDSHSETEVIVDEKMSLEKLAIRELIEGAKKTDDSTLTIPVSKTSKEADDAPIDYDNVPVSQFGYAMLKGMGWSPGMGIGKKQKVVEVQEPHLRAGRMCLGAVAPAPEDTSDSKR